MSQNAMLFVVYCDLNQIFLQRQVKAYSPMMTINASYICHLDNSLRQLNGLSSGALPY